MTKFLQNVPSDAFFDIANQYYNKLQTKHKEDLAKKRITKLDLWRESITNANRFLSHIKSQIFGELGYSTQKDVTHKLKRDMKMGLGTMKDKKTDSRRKGGAISQISPFGQSYNIKLVIPQNLTKIPKKSIYHKKTKKNPYIPKGDNEMSVLLLNPPKEKGSKMKAIAKLWSGQSGDAARRVGESYNDFMSKGLRSNPMYDFNPIYAFNARKKKGQTPAQKKAAAAKKAAAVAKKTAKKAEEEKRVVYKSQILKTVPSERRTQMSMLLGRLAKRKQRIETGVTPTYATVSKGRAEKEEWLQKLKSEYGVSKIEGKKLLDLLARKYSPEQRYRSAARVESLASPKRKKLGKHTRGFSKTVIASGRTKANLVAYLKSIGVPSDTINKQMEHMEETEADPEDISFGEYYAKEYSKLEKPEVDVNPYGLAENPMFYRAPYFPSSGKEFMSTGIGMAASYALLDLIKIGNVVKSPIASYMYKQDKPSLGMFYLAIGASDIITYAGTGFGMEWVGNKWVPQVDSSWLYKGSIFVGLAKAVKSLMSYVSNRGFDAKLIIAEEGKAFGLVPVAVGGGGGSEDIAVIEALTLKEAMGTLTDEEYNKLWALRTQFGLADIATRNIRKTPTTVSDWVTQKDLSDYVTADNLNSGGRRQMSDYMTVDTIPSRGIADLSGDLGYAMPI